MVDHRFDQLAKQLTRRRVTKVLLASGAAGAVGVLRSPASKADSCHADFAAMCATRCAAFASLNKSANRGCVDGCLHIACGA